MLAIDRQNKIMKNLHKNKTMSVTEFSKILNVSESTIRRDINILNDKNKLKKVHGGATLISDSTFSTEETSVIEKNLINIEEKKAIAKYAASLIHDKDIIYLDAGTTTALIVNYIKNTDSIFITNCIETARKLTKLNKKNILLGGNIKLNTDSVVGEECIKSLSKYNFNLAFLGTNGITTDEGFTTPDPREANVKSYAISKARNSYVLADSEKFDKIYQVTFAEISLATIITEDTKNIKVPKEAKIINVSQI